MIYKTLSPEETNHWLDTLKQTIELGDKVAKYWSSVEDDVRSKFKKQITSKWYWRFWLNGAEVEDIYISWGGRISHFNTVLCSFDSIREITYAETLTRDFGHEWFYGAANKQIHLYQDLTTSCSMCDMYRSTYRAWSVFAEQPLQVHEKDIGRFMDIESTLSRLQKLATRLDIK